MKIKKGPSKTNQGTVLTTEEEEIQSRQQRGQKESIEITPQKYYPFPFDTYSVKSSTGLLYEVEIRSLTDAINTCSCPDFQVNTLGTCKHVEAVVCHLQTKTRNSKNAQVHSPLVEIFLDTTDSNCVSIAWPPHIAVNSELKAVLKPFFSSNDTLIADPIIALPALQNALKSTQKLQEQVRISSQLKSWVALQKEKQAHVLSREQFLTDVKEGKRSLQMLSATLYPYQEEGMLHLAFQGRALLADEMGLGKTIQAIAACELLRRLRNVKKVLVISPASLKGEWEEQIARFTGLQTLIIQGNRGDRLAMYQQQSFFYLANYEQVRSDFEEIQRLLSPDIIILDEAQRIKNWQTKTAWAVKQLKSPYAFVLTGTPIENRIDEIYSIMQMVDPQVLGPLFKFNREFYQFNEKNKPIGYQNLDELHRRLKPTVLRRLKKDVEEQLPERTVNNFYVEMAEEQKIRYDEYNDRVARLLIITKRRPLTEDETKKLQQYLACMRMLADTPYILDEECKICPKLDELRQILSELMQNPDNKIIIFSEWERMLLLVQEMIKNEFKCEFAWHTGSVPQQKRRQDIKRFKEDPQCRFFLTTDAGSTGLNLQVANVVINMDLPWNPAKLEQRIARAWRKNQTRAVQVINFITADSIESRMLTTLAQKQTLASGVLDGIGDLTDMPMPSARKAVLEQLEELLCPTETVPQPAAHVKAPAPEQKNPVETSQAIANDIQAHFNDRVHQLTEFQSENSPHKTIVAVMDTLDRGAQLHVKTIVQTNDAPQNGSVQVELIDLQTYELLQRLAKAGMITINDSGTDLYRSHAANRTHQTEKQQRLSEAKKHFADAERKMKMARLLVSGGFVLEALPPASEGLACSIKSYFSLKRQPYEKGQELLSRCQVAPEKLSEAHASTLLDLIESCHLECLENLHKTVF